MDSLIAEMERKRKQISSSDVTASKKMFKRADLAREQANEYERRESERIEGKVGSSAVRECAPEVDAAAESEAAEKLSERKYTSILAEELRRRLRERGEPVMLFGESHAEACQRLRVVEMITANENAGGCGTSRGLRNDFKAAMDRLDQACLVQLTADSGLDKDAGASRANDVKVDPSVVAMDEVTKMAEKIRTGDMQLDSKVVHEYLRTLGSLWGEDLNARELPEKMVLQGKLMSARYEQTMSYLKPLFSKLKQLSLSAGILDHLADICRHMINREYVKASDQYLQMAIGNAPWPIGVTNPGIHARTGREKISTSLVAHVLNDETQRKYIQGLKRLMTYAQKRFPTDPSKSLEYKGVNV